MLNNYLQIPSSLTDYSCSVLFMHPYVEAKNNFKACFAKLDKADISSLVGRVAHFVAHFVVGLLLLPPILNTITLLFLRLFSYTPEISPTLPAPGSRTPPAPQGSGLLTVLGNSSLAGPAKDLEDTLLSKKLPEPKRTLPLPNPPAPQGSDIRKVDGTPAASPPKGSGETVPSQKPSAVKKEPTAPQGSGLPSVLGNSSRAPMAFENPPLPKAPSLVPKPAAPQVSDIRTFSLNTGWGTVLQKECILEPPPVPKQPSFLPDPKTPLTDQEFIEKFVDVFLWPYIQGKIAPEDELQPRVSMMERLSIELRDRHTKLPVDEIKTIALNEYLYRSCLGLYIHLEKRWLVTIEHTSPEFFILVKALMQSLPKDFPDTVWSFDEVSEKAKEALRETNQKRNEEILQAADYPIAGRKRGGIAG